MPCLEMEPLALIIATCDRPRLLRGCLESCLSQDGFDPERDRVYVVNDSDLPLINDKGLPVTIDLFLKGGMTILTGKEFQYALASARNEGLEAALKDGYEIGIFLDDDEELLPGCLAAHREKFEGGKTIFRGMVATEKFPLDAFIGDFLERLSDVARIGKDTAKGLKRDLLWRILRFGGITNCAIDLQELSAAGGFNEKFDGEWGYEDTELINRLMLRDGWEMEFVREARAFHHKADPAGAYSRQEYSRNRRLFQKLVRSYREEE